MKFVTVLLFRDLEQTKRIYQKQKDSPPVHRNIPPVSKELLVIIKLDNPTQKIQKIYLLLMNLK